MIVREQVQVTDLEPSTQDDPAVYIIQVRGVNSRGAAGEWSEGIEFTAPLITRDQSEDYVGGEQGWAIDHEGRAEFNNVEIRGDLSSINYIPEILGWSLSRNGNAELNNATIRGDIQSDNYVTGLSGWRIERNGNAELQNPLIRGDIQSDNYVANISGWRIRRTGQAEFDQGIFRGDILGGTISIGTNAFRVDSAGNTWVGNAVFGNAPFRVSSAGTLDVTGATLTGGLIRTSVSGQRVEMSAAQNAYDVYDGNGNRTYRIRSVINGRTEFEATTGTRVVFSGSDGIIDWAANGDITISSRASSPRWQIDGTSGNFFTRGSVESLGAGLFGGDFTFRNTGSGRRFTMNAAFVGGSGSEPTLDTSGSNFGVIGLSGRPIWRGWANSWISTSVRDNKGEIADCDLSDAYEKLKGLPLYTYSLSRSREDYYTAKGEWILGERDEFDDPGGPLRRFGTMADEAPAEVTDGEGTGIDSYALASLVAAAVKHIQVKLELLEAALGLDEPAI